MWQAPALTIAAQAFLLQVLTNRSIDGGARALILAAGAIAGIAAVLSLLRLREREVRYSDAIAHYAYTAGIPEFRPDRLPRRSLERQGRSARFDRWLQRIVGWCGWPGVYLVWVLALVLFVVADIVAFLLTT
jgi:hypothetical protein